MSRRKSAALPAALRFLGRVISVTNFLKVISSSLWVKASSSLPRVLSSSSSPIFLRTASSSDRERVPDWSKSIESKMTLRPVSCE